MKLDQLNYFVETARRQHIGQAASFLHISPSAISHSIAALEDELGKTLFVKQGRRIKLTIHGKILLDRAEFLLSEVERIHEELSLDQLKIKGHYRIAATHLLCSQFFTPVWIEMQKEHPNLTGSIYSLRSGEVLSRVNASELDLGFCFCPHSDPDHEQEIIHRGKLLLCFGKGHPFFEERRINELDKYPYIAAKMAQGIENCENHPSFQKLNIRPKTINFFDSYDVAIAALKLNTVWTLLPEFLIYSHPELESYVPQGWNSEYTIAAIWPKYHTRTKALDCVIEKMSQTLKDATWQYTT